MNLEDRDYHYADEQLQALGFESYKELEVKMNIEKTSHDR